MINDNHYDIEQLLLLTVSSKIHLLSKRYVIVIIQDEYDILEAEDEC